MSRVRVLALRGDDVDVRAGWMWHVVRYVCDARALPTVRRAFSVDGVPCLREGDRPRGVVSQLMRGRPRAIAEAARLLNESDGA